MQTNTKNGTHDLKQNKKNVMKCNEIRMEVFAENAEAHDPT